MIVETAQIQQTIFVYQAMEIFLKICYNYIGL